MGLYVNEKEETKIVTRESYNENGCVKLGTYNFKMVKDYTYLGTVLTNKTT
jgi:hypothetical protein